MKKIILLVAIGLSSLLLAEGISGVSYFQYSINKIGTIEESRGFELNRVYLTYENIISDKLSYKFQSDMQNNGDAYYMYIKNANVDLSLLQGTHLVIGLQGMNMFTIQEKTWGNRFISKSAMDESGWSHAADLGVGLSQSFGDISGSILLTNGDGYKSIANDSNEKISILGAYGEKRLDKNDGFNIGLSASMEPYDFGETNTTTKNKTVMSVYAGYALDKLRYGLEFDTHTNEGTDIIQQITALYATYRIANNIDALLYLDIYDPDTGTTNDGETYVIAGFNYHPVEGLIISPNVRMTTPEEDADINEDDIVDVPTTQFMINFQFKF